MSKKRLVAVDAVVLAQVGALDQVTLPDQLRRAFERVGELAEFSELLAPLSVTLTDAHGRCLVTMTMSLYASGWIGRTESGDVDVREGLSFPWFLVCQDGMGRTLSVRVEFDPSSKPM